MLKKTNCLIVAFFVVLTSKYEMGFLFFIPIVMFYILRDSKNIFYFLTSSIISCYIFNRTYLIYLLIISAILVLFYFFLPKIKKGILIYIFLIFLNVSSTIALNITTDNIFPLLIYNIISIILYFYLERNLIKSLMTNSYLYQNAYLEIIIVMISIYGASTLNLGNINGSFILSVYFAMYFSSSIKDIFAMLYSIIVMIYLLFYMNISVGIFIPLISCVYLLPFVIPVIITNIFSAIIILSSDLYPMEYFIMIMCIGLLFEIFKSLFIKEKITDNDIYQNIYERVTKNVNNEILSFTRFLDYMANVLITSKETHELINQSIKVISNRHCANCSKKKECFKTNKLALYSYFKELIISKNALTPATISFSKNCERIKEIKYTIDQLHPKEIVSTTSMNSTLVAQIMGVSNAIKHYAIDMLAKDELTYETISDFKARLINYGYNIVYFDLVRTFTDDFLIDIGLKGVSNSDAIETIKIIGDQIILNKVSVILKETMDNISYYKVVPEIKIDIIYGYGAISSNGEEICGDNYLIKELQNGHFISAISDGMGKGYKAYSQSNNILKLVEEIVNLNLDSYTALEIINIFYSLQDYLDQYATLDFVEINRYAKIATFFKMGGTTSYIIKTDGTMQKINNKNLPIGIDDEVNNQKLELEIGDLILMSSDGVFENIVESSAMETFFTEIKELAPQKIVYELLNYTIGSKIQTSDDMTVIALKIKKV